MKYLRPLVLSMAMLSVACARHSKADSVTLPTFTEVADNISNKSITSFAQDRFGYMWIGTLRGLNKYNGNDFHSFYHNENPVSLCDNQVTSLLCDSKGRVWVGTVSGICHYTKEDNFHEIPISGFSHYINQIMETPQGTIVVNTGNFIEYYERDGDTFRIAFKLDEKTFPNTCYMDRSGRIWAVSPNSVRWYDVDNHAHKEVWASDKEIVYNSFRQENGWLWMCMLDGRILIYDTRNYCFIDTPKALTDNSKCFEGGIKAIYNGGENEVFIYTRTLKMYLFNTSTGKFLSQSESGFPFTVPHAELSALMFDNNKNLWIGSADQGFWISYSYKRQFNSNPFLASKLGGKSVIDLAEDSRGDVWILTNRDGIYVWNSTDNTVENVEIAKIPQSERPKHVFIDSRDNIYFVYGLLGVVRCRYDGKTLKSDFYYPIFTGATLYSMTEDSRGRLWLGAFGSNVFLLDKNSPTYKQIGVTVKNSYTFIPKIIELEDGRMMAVALTNGVTFIDPDTFATQTLSMDVATHGRPFIPTSLFRDSYGTIWIGTTGSGLLRFNTENNTAEQMKGLPCDDIADITEDSFGNVWISTKSGMARYDRTVDKFISYFASDGIGGNQFNETAGLLTSKGLMMFGGTHGLTVFNPIDISPRRKVTLMFEDLILNRQLQPAYNCDALDKHITEANKITLSQHRHKVFGISYSAIDYSEFPLNRYSYCLEGYSNDWIDARGVRRAYYSNLDPGKYVFRVRLWNNDYTRILAEKSINIIIRPVFWQMPVMKWVVYPILLILIIGLVYNLIMRSRRQKEEVVRAVREKEQERRMNDINMSFFLNVSHEMRTPLTMIKGPIDILCEDDTMNDENRKLLSIISRNVNRLLRFLNQLMDISKLDNDTLRLEVGYSDAVAVTNNMLDVFRLNANEKNIQLVTRGLDDSFITLLNEDTLEKILANLLSNAIKFTPGGGRIELDFDVVARETAAAEFNLGPADKASQYMRFTIGDTGCGIPAGELENIFRRYYQVEQNGSHIINYGTGIGLYYSRRLAELHHGHIKAANRQEGNGAIFVFIIPVGEEAYSVDRRRPDKEEQNYNLPSFAAAAQLPETATDTERPTLLIVEDDTELALFLKTIFAPAYKVINRYDADSTWSAIEEVEPDVIVSDIVMPGKMDGYALCRAVKENLSTCHIPVILLTAKTNVESQVEGLDSGADAYVMKPFDPSYLSALVKSQLANRDRLRSIIGRVTHTEKIADEKLSPYDKEFLDSLYELMEKELSNPELNITRMTEVLKIGRTKFYYKVKGLTGENPNMFFKTYKLNRAAQLLEDGRYNISEVADIAGFSTLSHFSVSFKKQFGVTPSEYQSGVRANCG